MDLRDHETEGHSRRVTEMTLRLARAMGLDEAELVHVRRGALLHDIGKMGIPDAILLKPGTLTDEEWQVMRRHPTYAYEMLSPIAFLRPALEIPYCHHEKWDGTGYPRGLKGEQIPLAARIFAAVDIWDALRSDRPYRKGWPEERVCEHIASLAGTHLDPAVVAAFLRDHRGRSMHALSLIRGRMDVKVVHRHLVDALKSPPRLRRRWWPGEWPWAWASSCWGRMKAGRAPPAIPRAAGQQRAASVPRPPGRISSSCSTRAVPARGRASPNWPGSWPDAGTG